MKTADVKGSLGKWRKVRYADKSSLPYFEPHYRWTGFLYLPLRHLAYVLRKFIKLEANYTYDEAIQSGKRIRLLTLRGLKNLFPKCGIFKEKLLGCTKSYIAYDGFV